MGSIPNEFPISLRAWPPAKSESTALPLLIQRINFERGGFQNITEESLRQEIIEEDINGADIESSDEEEDSKPDRLTELMQARDELLKQIDQGYQSALFALDAISMLLSRDENGLATSTVSQGLKDIVPLKTFGASKMAASQITEPQKQENKKIARGWKAQALDKTVDSILASATRLEKEIEHETKYWEQVLAVSDKGWAVCRLPNQKHILGVRFGFSEASPAFKSRSLAALRREADGSISLDQGLAESEPRALRVRIQENGEFTGSSYLPRQAADDAPTEAHILQARNTIFYEELWQELNREARTLGPVESKNDTLVCPLMGNKSMVIDLVGLDEPNKTSGPDNEIAEGLSVALSLLLSYTHRQTHRRRTQPPPPISSLKRPNAPIALLRAIVTRLNHQETLSQIHTVLRPLCEVLKSASITPAPQYTLAQVNRDPSPIFTTAERTMLSIFDNPESVLTFTITPTTTITVTITTYTFFSGHSQPFRIQLSPDSPLLSTCPPYERLSTWQAVSQYILFATSCALTSSISSTSDDREGWIQTAQANTIKKVLTKAKRSKQLTFSINYVPASENKSESIRFRAAWEWLRGEMTGKGEDISPEKVRGKMWGTGYVGSSDVDKIAESEERKIEGEGGYEWVCTQGQGVIGWGDGEGEVVRSLSDVVEAAGR